MKRKEIANIILDKLKAHKEELSLFYATENSEINYFFIDDLLPESLVMSLHREFPLTNQLNLKKSLKEHKFVSAQMNLFHPALEEVLYAFQDKQIVQLIQEICKINVAIEPDDKLYAGGLSLMGKDCFLNPHLDNSHDSERNQWRALNLLYYITPDWKLQNGGNLELWPNGLDGDVIEICSKFNRLVVMATHQKSWHSVNKVLVAAERKCISNYYFSKEALAKHQDFHVTTFKGRPNQKLRNVLLKADSNLRMGIRKLFKNGIRKNPHIYKNKK